MIFLLLDKFLSPGFGSVFVFRICLEADVDPGSALQPMRIHITASKWTEAWAVYDKETSINFPGPRLVHVLWAAALPACQQGSALLPPGAFKGGYLW